MGKAYYIFSIFATCCTILTGQALGQSKLQLSSLSPNHGPVGSVILLRGEGFTETANTVHFGPGGQTNVSSAKGGTEISYTIPSSVGPCDLIVGCMAPSRPLMPGPYPIYVSNARGRSNELIFEVTR
jgi:hypothetical protein